MNRLIKRISGFSDRKLLIFLFILAFALRFGYSYYAYLNIDPSDPELFNNLYYLMALDIVDQGKIFYETDHPYKDVVGPVMPLLCAFSIFIFGNNWFGIFFFTSLASALIVLFIAKTCLLIFDRYSALIAGLWSAFSPLYLYFTPGTGKDIWMSFFLIFIIYYLIKLFNFKQYSLVKFVLFAMVFVVSIHLDERYIIFAPIAFLYILYSETNHFKKPAFAKSALFTLLVILFMIPWTIRNYHKYDRIVLLSTRTERITDKLFGLEPRENFLDNAYGTELYYIHDYQIDSVINGTKTVTDGGFRINEATRKAIQKGNLPKPFTKMEAFWSRLTVMFAPVQFGGTWERTGYYYNEKSLSHNLSSFIFYGIMLFFSIPGFYLLYKRDPGIFFLLICILLIYTAIHVLTIPYTVWRYRLPLDAIFIVVGSFGLTSLVKQYILAKWNLNL